MATEPTDIHAKAKARVHRLINHTYRDFFVCRHGLYNFIPPTISEAYEVIESGVTDTTIETWLQLAAEKAEAGTLRVGPGPYFRGILQQVIKTRAENDRLRGQIMDTEDRKAREGRRRAERGGE